MTQAVATEEKVRSRILSIVTHAIQENEVYQALNPAEEAKKHTDFLLERRSSEELLAMPAGELTRKIRQLMAVNQLYGLIANFTPEQMREFDEAVKRK